MKSVGLAVILAQIGYYVPCSTFCYQPYMAIFARITGNDNIQKGLSSFVLEMSELKTFIKRTKINGDKILVIGDEVCRGTEIYSGISIVITALEFLSQRNASFIFTSHFHTIIEQPEFKELKNIKVCHIKVNVDKDKIIYDRVLTDGIGPKVYGLVVAKHIINDNEFIERANTICNRLLGNDKSIVKSNFNNNLYMNKCEMCFYKPINETDKELETHHLYYQKNCNDKGMIDENNHIHKNHLSNLIVLCRNCHMMMHNSKNLKVEKIIETNDGRILKFTSK
jgi:DNA mismatch repair protein MutS